MCKNKNLLLIMLQMETKDVVNGDGALFDAGECVVSFGLSSLAGFGSNHTMKVKEPHSLVRPMQENLGRHKQHKH